MCIRDSLSQWGSRGSGDGQFIYASGIAVAGDGTVYVADAWSDRIQHFTAAGAFLNQLGGRGSGEGQFDGPWGIAVDAEGNFYVADTGNHRLQVFTPDGDFITWWGREG